MTPLNADFFSISPIALWTAQTDFNVHPEFLSWNVTETTPINLQHPIDFSDCVAGVSQHGCPLSRLDPVSLVAPTLTPQILRKELLASVLPSWRTVVNDLRAHPVISLSLFLGVGITAAIEPIPHFDKAILAIGSGTAIWMLASGIHLARQALLEQSATKFLNAKTEFGVGALSLLIMGATLAGLTLVETAEIFEPFRPTGDSNRTIKVLSSLLHCGDEIVAGITIFKRLSTKN